MRGLKIADEKFHDAYECVISQNSRFGVCPWPSEIIFRKLRRSAMLYKGHRFRGAGFSLS